MKKALDYCTRILKRDYGIEAKVEYSETGKKIVFLGIKIVDSRCGEQETSSSLATAQCCSKVAENASVKR